jgi:CrcB protein
VTGFLGGLTTFSTFSCETVNIIQSPQYSWACAVIVAHVVGSLLLTLAGIGIVRFALRA